MKSNVPAGCWKFLPLLAAVLDLYVVGCSPKSPGTAGSPESVQTSAKEAENRQEMAALTPPAQTLLPADYRGIDENDGRRDVAPPPAPEPASPPRIPGQGIDPLTLAPTSSGRLACNLLAPLRMAHSGNLFYSPRNVRSALMLAYEGARGETAAQLARVIGIDPDQVEELDSSAITPPQSATPSAMTVLNSANRIWPNHREPLRLDYVARVKSRYGADVVPLDFLQQADVARRDINDWTAAQTRDKIRDLLQPGAVGSSTRMVLTSAIYFQADWLNTFDKSHTQNSPFLASAEERVEVPLMQQELSVPWVRIPGAQIVELPYADARHSMLVLLPDQVKGLPELESRLTSDDLANWTRDMKVTRVQLSLPRFKLTVAISLTSALKSLGVTQAFQSDANFSGMSDAPGLFLSEVVHQAFVSVDEKGTEAAAATALVMRGGPANLVVFRADHPFLFLIRDRVSHDILFVGCLVRPE